MSDDYDYTYTDAMARLGRTETRLPDTSWLPDEHTPKVQKVTSWVEDSLGVLVFLLAVLLTATTPAIVIATWKWAL